MTIKFEFTVSDEDAEAIMDCVTLRIADLKGLLRSNACSEAEKTYIRKHVEYLQGFPAKMKNTRV